ncbi:MAG: hypothetical protein ACE5I1_00765 [bacterium]
MLTIKICIYFVISCLVVLNVNSCAPTSQLTKAEITQLLAKHPESWTSQQCDSIIRSYTSSNIPGYDASNPYQSTLGNKVYIKAAPFNRHVICATVRKEAFQKRFSTQKFRQRLKEDLESFTNFTIDPQNGKITGKPKTAASVDEFTFLVYFENITDPHRTIEVYKAEEGFFLEHKNGDFSRVKEISGSDIGNYFTLWGDLNAMITFSAFTDDGKRFSLNEGNIGEYRLVFNGLQEKSIVLRWGHF